MRKAGYWVALLLVMVVGLNGCATGTPPGGGGAARSAEVRMANAQIGGVAFDVCVDGTAVIENSRYGTFTDYTEVPSGNRQFSAILPGTSCTNPINILFGLGGSINVGAGSQNTLVLLADGDTTFLLTDDNAPTPANRARIRLVNAVEDSLALTLGEENSPAIFESVRYDEPGDYGYTNVVAATYDLVVTPLAGDQTPIEINNVQFEAGRVYTLFAIGRIDGEGEAFQLVVEEDSQPGVVQ